MKLGQLVMLIGTDGYTPPFGALGYICSEIDKDNDYEVDFPSHPCPVEDPTWFCHISWLLPINLDPSVEDYVHLANNKINLAQQ